MKTILTILAITITTFSFAQDAIDQLDANGKKNGKTTIYLDKNWIQVSADQAVYTRYTHYDHGTNVYPMGPAGRKGYTVQSSSDAKVLNGEYTWKNAKGNLSSVHVFKNGEYVSCKEYSKSGKVSQHFDYTNKCEGQPHGWSVTVYDKNGNVQLTKKICKDANGVWPNMRG